MSALRNCAVVAPRWLKCQACGRKATVLEETLVIGDVVACPHNGCRRYSVFLGLWADKLNPAIIGWVWHELRMPPGKMRMVKTAGRVKDHKQFETRSCPASYYTVRRKADKKLAIQNASGEGDLTEDQSGWHRFETLTEALDARRRRCQALNKDMPKDCWRAPGSYVIVKHVAKRKGLRGSPPNDKKPQCGGQPIADRCGRCGCHEPSRSYPGLDARPLCVMCQEDLGARKAGA